MNRIDQAIDEALAQVSAAEASPSAADSTTGPEGAAHEAQSLSSIAAGPGISMTDAEKEAQRRSFAYGNVAIENPNVTRAMVDEEAEKLSFRDVPWDLMSERDFDAEMEGK